jgi:hypothetical protein
VSGVIQPSERRQRHLDQICIQRYSYVISARNDLISAKVQKNADITLPDVRSCQQKTTKESTQTDTRTLVLQEIWNIAVFTSFSVQLVQNPDSQRGASLPSYMSFIANQKANAIAAK